MIPYYRPYYNHLELLAALRPGPARHKFESAIAARAGVRYGVTFAYGRAGFVAALKALGLTEAEIILPAYTCLVMAHAVMASGNYPAFADINLTDYNMDIGALKRALTPQTRAVIATHMYGYPTDVDAIRAAVGDERIIIVEDCALGLHILSSESNGLRGDLGFFSFGAGKPISTYEGGGLVTHSSDLYKKIKAYRDREMNQSSFKAQARRWARFLVSYVMFRERTYGLLHQPKSIHKIRRKFNLPPNYLPNDIAMALPDFQARVGLVQLPKLDIILAKRRALARLYDQELQDCPGIHLPSLIDNASFTHYTVRVPKRDESGFEQRMLNRGVAIDRAYDYALPYLKPYRPFAQGEYPRAAQAAREAVNLPCYPHLQEAQARYIAACVRDCL